MKYHLLSIGISKHQDPQANLRFASKDASEFFSLFTENISNLGYSKLLTDNEATLSSIRTALGTELENQIEADDCFILYYSGHGAIAPESEQREVFSHFLIPFDVTQDISNSAIPVDYIKDIFKKLKCKSKLFFVDSCFSGSVNSKAYGPAYKSIKKLKTVSGEISGDGRIVFTASKDDEEAIEDPKLGNSVFTSFLLDEFQEKKTGEKFSVTDILTPVSEKVIAYTQKEHHFKQTPTFSGDIQGVLYLPTFKKPLHIKPGVIDTPKSQSVVGETPASPIIDIDPNKEKNLISGTIKFVLRTAKSDPLLKLEFEKFALEVGRKLIKKWGEIFKSSGQLVERIPDAVAKMEAESYQLFILSAAVGVYGNQDQAKLIGEICGNLLKTTRDKSGLIALVNVPEVIVLFVEYILAITAQASVDFSKLKTFLSTKIYGMRYDTTPPSMLSMYHTHYADSLGGNADKVADYVRKSLANMEWLKTIHPRMDAEDMTDLQLQANFILVMTRFHYKYHVWPDFGRFYSTRTLPIIEHIKYDTEFIKALAELFHLEVKDLRPKLIEHTEALRARGMGSGYFWSSIDGDDLLTYQEVQDREKARRAKEVK